MVHPERSHARFVRSVSVDTFTYLKKWPYLRSENDLDTYAREAKKTEQRLQKYTDKRQGRSQTTPDFHKSLRAALGQA